MKILYWLYRSHLNSKGLMPLMMRITFKGQRSNFPTQINIPEHQWDKDKQQIKGTDELTIRQNRLLLTLTTKAWDFYEASIRQDKVIAAQQIKKFVLGEDGAHHTLLEAVDYQIESLTARIGKDIAPRTVRNYKIVKSKLLRYLQLKGLEDISLVELNHQFIQEFDQFMRVQEGLRNNGVVKNMQQLKRILRVAILNEWLEKDPFAHYQCKLIEPKRVILTWDELQVIENMPLPNERLEKVRDIFIFACWTGLAYADLSKLTSQHIMPIEGREWIFIERTKTKNQSSVPLFPKAKAILEKYRSNKTSLLPVMASQNLNKYLKELAQLAGINKRLTVHVGRHVFASTVMLNRGVDITSVSTMLGHRMIRTTQIYARVNLSKIANDVQDLMEEGGD